MKTTTTMGLRTLMVLMAVGVLAACDSSPELEVRTFSLSHLRPHEAQPLIEPYVFGDREGAPGAASATERGLTVRETSDNLDQIERVLAEFDQAREDVRLHFQLIEANGFTDQDPRIQEVESELRKIFQFAGYRLAGEAFVGATDRSDFAQHIAAESGRFEITGSLFWLQPGVMRLDGVTLVAADSNGSYLRTSVNIRAGQTLVLGSSPKAESTATLLLTVRAEAVSAPAGQ